MGIPASQIEVWAKQGSVTKAMESHHKLRDVLNHNENSIIKTKSIQYSMFLQGSYINNTNIRGNSDVDLVVMLESTFYSNKESLSKYDQDRHSKSFPTASYHFNDFKSDVLNTLLNHYGMQKVEVGSKSIKVKMSDGYWADVVPVALYRKYLTNKSGIDFSTDYMEGVYFTSSSGQEIINFPKQHKENGYQKNSDTNGMSKKMVRAFKNARIRLLNEGIISKDLAPSYFIENLIYNVPNRLFTADYDESFINIIAYLTLKDMEMFLCQNEQDFIFGMDPWKWNIGDAKQFVSYMKALWEVW
ncbi:nucleotidyltransferase [Peribacillus acanthi]|uniref:nucleotidyltransferase domain-containing protein n=1 Tax=Peribacillus acanthi TaxID=2171554 RepID=UPI000D3E3D2A|nr:nucleotidyltransferase [Peribacillus acanthi]